MRDVSDGRLMLGGVLGPVAATLYVAGFLNIFAGLQDGSSAAAILGSVVVLGFGLAMVVGMSLSRHQAKRLNPPDREGVAHFFSRAEAEAWLFSDDRTDAQYRHAPASPMSADHGYIGPSAA